MIANVIDSSLRRASGSLFGLAYGDALGKPTEFLTVAEIVRRYGPTGPRELVGEPALVTDDTQMALAVGWALHDAPAYTPEANPVERLGSLLKYGKLSNFLPRSVIHLALEAGQRLEEIETDSQLLRGCFHATILPLPDNMTLAA